MYRPPALSAWADELQRAFPALTRPQAKVLAPYSLGMALRPHIRPTAPAGNVRLYNETTFDLICAELDGIDARRAHREAAHAA